MLRFLLKSRKFDAREIYVFYGIARYFLISQDVCCAVGRAKCVEHLVGNQLSDACLRTALDHQRL